MTAGEADNETTPATRPRDNKTVGLFTGAHLIPLAPFGSGYGIAYGGCGAPGAREHRPSTYTWRRELKNSRLAERFFERLL